MLQSFKQFLANKGISITEEEQRITFVQNDLYFLFVHEKSDPFYFRLILPNIYKIENNKDKYEKFINDLNKRVKVAKTSISDDNMIWSAVEQFVYSMENVEQLFERSVALLEIMMKEEFIKNLDNLNDK